MGAYDRSNQRFFVWRVSFGSESWACAAREGVLSLPSTYITSHRCATLTFYGASWYARLDIFSGRGSWNFNAVLLWPVVCWVCVGCGPSFFFDVKSGRGRRLYMLSITWCRKHNVGSTYLLDVGGVISYLWFSHAHAATSKGLLVGERQDKAWQDKTRNEQARRRLTVFVM